LSEQHSVRIVVQAPDKLTLERRPFNTTNIFGLPALASYLHNSDRDTLRGPGELVGSIAGVSRIPVELKQSRIASGRPWSKVLRVDSCTSYAGKPHIETVGKARWARMWTEFDSSVGRLELLQATLPISVEISRFGIAPSV